MRRRSLRLLLLFIVAAAMALGLWGGLARLGVPLPDGLPLAELHGPLMIAGVFGTLISLERAVAMGGFWPYLAPLASALGAVLLVVGVPAPMGVTLLVMSASILLLASLRILLLQPALFTLVLAAGAAVLLAGNLFWLLGGEVTQPTGWWLAFLVTTIAAERLELSRVLRHGLLASLAFIVALLAVLAGAAFSLTGRSGTVLMGTGFLAMTLWLLRFDIATRTVRSTGRARFLALAMLAGYLWLAVAGITLLAASHWTFGHDMTLHAVCVGFVLSMVFGHALIILPAVTGIRLNYHPTLYLPLILLHASVTLRIGAGLAEWPVGRLASGALTTLALVTFAITLAWAARRKPLPHPLATGSTAR